MVNFTLIVKSKTSSDFFYLTDSDHFINKQSSLTLNLFNSVNSKASIKKNKMRYKVHRLDVKRDNIQDKLEKYINQLNGEIVSIVPNVRPTFQIMGATAKIDFLLIVEKLH